MNPFGNGAATLVGEIVNPSLIAILPQIQYPFGIGAVASSLESENPFGNGAPALLGKIVTPSGLRLAAHIVKIQSPFGNAVIEEYHNYWSIDIEHDVSIHGNQSVIYVYLCMLTITTPSTFRRSIRLNNKLDNSSLIYMSRGVQDIELGNDQDTFLTL